ncbi:Endocytosis and vacuole integrity protein [Malassezia nana]|uniref:Endocytosis and vacuole integrity protein n=1 Tax=Malassezia nana TaxID=180528 RepID=A0AAF0EF73_9BASI|nr:Endocytosis and vacuole integrity protein [Malassezia nana]
MPQRIVSELQVLVAETRRKYPDVRSAAEKVLQQLQSDTDGTMEALRQSPDVSDHPLVQAIVLACETRSPKVIQIALSLLHRSIMLRAVSEASLVLLVETLHTLLTAPGRADVDVQLKILQTVSALLLNYECVTSKLLSRALMLCFTLYEHSRVAVVSSTAAATLRQNIMTVFDKVHKEDRIFDAIVGEDAAAKAPLPALTAQLPDGPVTLFASSSDAYLVLNDLCALADGEPASFLPLATLSKPFVLELLESVLTNHASLFLSTRHRELVYLLRSAVCPLLLKALSEPPPFSVYVRAMRLVRLLLREFSEEVVLEVEMLLRALLKTMNSHHVYWQQILAWETVRDLYGDKAFVQRLWQWFDGREDVKDPPRVMAGMLTSLVDGTHKAKQSLMVDAALAASFEQRPNAPSTSTRKVSSSLYDAAVAGVRSAAEGLLSPRLESLSIHSVPSISLLDQLDKTEAPPMASTAVPTTYLPWLVLQSLVHLAQGLATWVPPQAPLLVACTRPLNEGLSFFLTVCGADKYFEQALQALANLVQAAGLAACYKERDLFLGTLCDLAVPSAAYTGQALMPRNLAAQAALVQVCITLAEQLGSRWRATLQSVSLALACLEPDGTAQSPACLPGKPGALPAPDRTLRFLAPSTLSSLPARLRSVVEYVASLESTRIQFAQVLARLVQNRVHDAPESSALPSVLLVQWERFLRACAPAVSVGLPDGVWLALMELAPLLEDPAVIAPRRLLCARVLDRSLQCLLEAIPHDEQAGARQRHILEALARQGTLKRHVQPTDVALRRLALETLQTILETQAHALSDGWDTVFSTCEAAACDATAIREAGTVPVPILRTAFACVQLICGSHLLSLSDTDVNLCMATLRSFSLQTEDVSMALRANGTLWDLTEDIDRRHKDHPANLWLELLQHWRTVAQGPQADVAAGALANLFQVLVQYSASLGCRDWYSVLDQVLMPLVEADAPSSLALEGMARILIMARDLRSEETWAPMWMRWLQRIQHLYATGPDPVAQAAVQALCDILEARAEPAALWRPTWTCIQDLTGLRPSASIADLCILVRLLQIWHAQRDATWHANDSQLMTRALARCMQRGMQSDFVSSTTDLRRLASLAQQAMEQLLATEKAHELVLQSTQQCCLAALEAAEQTQRSAPRIHAVCVELAHLWLEQWYATYRAEPRNPVLYSSAVPVMLRLLSRPLSTYPVPHVPTVWSLAMDVLAHVCQVGAHVSLAPAARQAFWETLLAALLDALCAPAKQRPTDDQDTRTWRLVQALEYVLGCAGTQPALHPLLRTSVRELLPATLLTPLHEAPHRPGRSAHRERLAYWLWAMLCRLCGEQDQGGTILLPLLLSQCELLLRAYAQDLRIRGAIPMPRARIEQVNFLLHSLTMLRLPTHSPSVSDAVPEPSLHLFLLGPVIDDLATIPSSTCAAPQKACVGTSLPRLPCEGSSSAPPRPPTTPQALAREALQQRTSCMHVTCTDRFSCEGTKKAQNKDKA